MTNSKINLDSTAKATYSEIHYNTEEVISGSEPYDIVDFVISQDDIQIAANGDSVFVDAQGILEDGTIVELSEYADWNSDNPEIVFADRGRLLGLHTGTATITVTYGDFTKNILSSVLNEIDLAIVISNLNKGKVQLKTQKAATNIGKEMVMCSWTPAKNFRGWRNKFVFEAGKRYTGISYSQTVNQVDNLGYIIAQSKSDFYTDYTRIIKNEEIIMPRYGNDCSGFVSLCWSITKQTTDGFIKGIINGTYTKVGSYDPKNPSKSELKASYRSLVAGNAVVKGGHIFLIASNNTKDSKVIAYEQTPPKLAYTSWDYDKMAGANYMPFKK